MANYDDNKHNLRFLFKADKVKWNITTRTIFMRAPLCDTFLRITILYLWPLNYIMNVRLKPHTQTNLVIKLYTWVYGFSRILYYTRSVIWNNFNQNNYILHPEKGTFQRKDGGVEEEEEMR